jgi:putative ABC transport system permease protein
VAAGATPNWQMFYRFAAHDTDAQLTADRQAVAGAGPAGAMLGSQSYLDAKRQMTGNVNVFVPFLVVFGLLGLFLSVLIIGIVVSGAVVTALRRIGILKALGFTPGQVARAYVAQALIPAGVGSVLGVFCANLLAGPVLIAARARWACRAPRSRCGSSSASRPRCWRSSRSPRWSPPCGPAGCAPRRR